ncbi:16S rRNA (cytosine(967)-C(5))-methyltransferase RsmB [Actinobacillus delphinicola]|nr:16S rRNA (cytosine(967)-C(5))-methyltransferase RsmB [Actinobacillus delphinicola]
MKNTKKLSKNEACNVRALAAEILLKMQQGQSLSALLPEYQNRVPAKDFPLLQEITFGVARVLPRLEKILTYLLDKPLKGKTRIVQCLLLVGLYQILYTRVPEFAAVDEVVNATKSLKVDNMRALVNAVLRRFLREKEEILTKADKHWHTMHPDWFINLLKPVYPNWREIIEANNQKPPMWLRVNAKIARDDYRQALQANGIETATDLHPQALRLLEACGVQKLPNFDEGDVTVQDVHAQWAARLLEPQNGELILDACAAPGGKTTHILELAPEAQVVALDVEENRLKRVRENLARLKQSAEIICADASNPQAWWKNKPQFDKILLDAPCSATGVIRRHPDIKWLRQPEDIPQLVALQYKILEAMWTLLKDNGTLLYATCSVLAQENRQQIERFLKAHPDAELVMLPFAGQTAESVGQQFLPQPDGGDGFFYAKLKKHSKESK